MDIKSKKNYLIGFVDDKKTSNKKKHPLAVDCPCGGRFMPSNQHIHNRTQLHKSFLLTKEKNKMMDKTEQ